MFLIDEDVAEAGTFKITSGLVEEFGTEGLLILNLTGFMGLAVGAAMTG